MAVEKDNIYMLMKIVLSYICLNFIKRKICYFDVYIMCSVPKRLWTV